MVVGAARAVVGAARVVSGGTVFARTVASSTDDAEERTTDGVMQLTSTNLDLGYSAGDAQLMKVFLRFTNITLTAANTVDNAHIQFAAFAADSASITLRIWGVDQDNQGTATTTASFITNLVKTTAFVDWTPAAWATPNEQATAQKTPNLKTIVDEIKARPGWASGNAMAFIIEWQSGTATGVREALSYNGNPGLAPALEINGEAPPAGEFDFSTLGLSCDLDARAGVTVTGLGVSDWQDQGTANKDAVQTTDADRPSGSGVTVNGFAAVGFDNANGEYLDWALTSSSAGTIFVVGQVGATPDSDSDAVLGSGAGSASGDPGISIQTHTDTTWRLRISDGTTRTVVNGGALAAAALFIVGVRWSATQMGIRINGGSEVTGTPPGAGSGAFGSVAFDIGRKTPYVIFWDGKITRILAAPTARLGDSNFSTAFTELNGIYGVY